MFFFICPSKASPITGHSLTGLYLCGSGVHGGGGVSGAAGRNVVKVLK
ncbi:MAG: hypothetical protein Q8O48_09395 [Anaerolineales bacterium]|nr:hypothetical protein [Anaerolineales bacterium]